MNINPQAIRILCYGDSITYGRIPNSRERYPNNVRRTWQLQKLLGSWYEIIEEGLRWRTTHLNNPVNAWRNGLEYFYPCILSHYPLDYIIIILWTNDLQKYFDEDIVQSAQSFITYNELIDKACNEFDIPKPKVILIAPPLVNWALSDHSMFSFHAQSKSQEFAQEYKIIADQLWRIFLDSSIQLWYWVNDWIHLSPEQNTQLAQLIYQSIATAYGRN